MYMLREGTEKGTHEEVSEVYNTNKKDTCSNAYVSNGAPIPYAIIHVDTIL